MHFTFVQTLHVWSQNKHVGPWGAVEYNTVSMHDQEDGQ